MGKMLGSLKSIGGGGGGDAAEIKSLQLEISGLETMESERFRPPLAFCAIVRRHMPGTAPH